MLRRSLFALIFVVLLVPGSEVLWTARHLPHLGQTYDDGIYWVTAKALAAGAGYRNIFLPGEPYMVKYPPAYPMFMSLAWRAQPEFPRNLSTAVFLQATLLPLHIALLFLLFRQLGLSLRRTFLLLALGVTCTEFMLLTCSLMSEILFDCFLFAAALAVERSAAGERGSGWAVG